MIVIIEFVTTIMPLPLVQWSWASTSLFLVSSDVLFFFFSRPDVHESKFHFYTHWILLACCVFLPLLCLFFRLTHSFTHSVLLHSFLWKTHLPQNVSIYSSTVSLISYTFDLKTINVQASSIHIQFAHRKKVSVT